MPLSDKRQGVKYDIKQAASVTILFDQNTFHGIIQIHGDKFTMNDCTV